MSELYDPKFTRKKFGNYDKNKGFVSVVGGTDSYFLEDEFNEMQRIQNEARAELFRAKYHSGIFKKNDTNGRIIYSDNVVRPNFFAFKELTTLINGYLFEVSGNLGNLDSAIVIKDPTINNVILPEPPTTGYREDLVYLEMWFSELKWDSKIWKNGNENNFAGSLMNDIMDNRVNGETCRRIQLQWAIRVAPDALPGIGFDELLKGKAIKAQGGYTALSDYTFWRADKRLDGQFKSKDKGLWVAGTGIPGEMNTVDGYVYAIPLFKVCRRNSSVYSDFNLNGGVLYHTNTTVVSDRPDGKFSNIIYEDDIVDLRHMVNVESNEYKKILDRNFSKLLTGRLTGLSRSKILGSYFGLDPITPNLDTVMYLNFNKTVKNGDNDPTGSVSYSFVPGVEQEAIKLETEISGLTYAVNTAINEICIQLMVKLPDYADRDIISAKNNIREIFSCSIRGNKLVVEDYLNTPLISVDILASNMPNLKDFTHIGISWSLNTKKIYLILNGNIVGMADITTAITASTMKQLILGYSERKLGSKGTIFDEVELATRFTTSFAQLPADFIQGSAKITIDIQKGRRSYLSIPFTSTITNQINCVTDSTGTGVFMLNAPTGSKFTGQNPTLYYDNEAVVVTNVTWTIDSETSIRGTLTGLGGNVKYNFVVLYEVRFNPDQGFSDLPRKMYKLAAEENAMPFIPVRSDRTFEEHKIDRTIETGYTIGTVHDMLRAYHPNISSKLGFSSAFKIYVKSIGGTVLYIPKKIYGQDIISVFDVGVADDPYRQNLLANIDISGASIKITLATSVSSNTTLEIIAATMLSSVVYNYTGGGIETMVQTEKFHFDGDGVTKTFIHRSNSKILNSLAANINGSVKFIAYVDGKSAEVSATFAGTFAAITFKTAPANKAKIDGYIVSEYDPLRSERIKAWFETLEYQGTNNLNYMISFDNTPVISHLDSIFVTTDGLNAPIETRSNKISLNTAYLPITGPLDSKIIPRRIFGSSTNARTFIHYAEANDNDFNDNLPLIDKLKLKIAHINNGRGYSGFVTIDDKSFYSTDRLTSPVPHLNVFPILVKTTDTDLLKMIVITTYVEDVDIKISGRNGESAIDVFDLDENILVK